MKHGNPEISSGEWEGSGADVAALLALKRYERPPAGYVDRFVVEFQRRQRAELLARTPQWRAWLEEVVERLEAMRVPAAAYATATVAALVVAAGIFLATPNAAEQGAGAGLASGGGEAERPVKMELHAPPPEGFVRPVQIPSWKTVSSLPTQYLLERRPSAQAEPFQF